MYSHSFSQKPAITSVNPNHNMGYLPQFAGLPFNYQFSPNSFPQLPFHQWTAMQAYYAQFMAQQQSLLVRSSPSITSSGTQRSETPSTCIVIDDDTYKEFEEKQESSSIDEHFGRFDSRTEASFYYPKILQKVEDIDEKLEDDIEEKQEAFGEDFEEKQEHFDSSSSESCLGNFKSSTAVCFGQKNLKVSLKEIVTFIIEHHGQIRETDLEKERAKYKHDKTLSLVFETLYSKYSSTFKTRAEIVKYITRKAFSTIKNNSKKKVDSSSKEACEVLCKRYFQASTEEIQSSGVDIEKRERFLQLLFPYQKNSKNKMQDMELISKLMSSKEFYEDYCLYVKNLDSILEADNNRKLPKFINFILSCVKKNQIDNILKFKRVPWLKSWIENTKSLARELAFSIQWKSQQSPLKQIKSDNLFDKENFQ